MSRQTGASSVIEISGRCDVRERAHAQPSRGAWFEDDGETLVVKRASSVFTFVHDPDEKMGGVFSRALDRLNRWKYLAVAKSPTGEWRIRRGARLLGEQWDA